MVIHNSNPQCWNALLYHRKIEEVLTEAADGKCEFLPLGRAKNADVIIVWSCLILTPLSHDKVMGDIRFFRQLNPTARIVLSGCYMNQDYQTIREKEFPWLEYVPGRIYEVIAPTLDLKKVPKPADYHILKDGELHRKDGPDYLLYQLPQHPNRMSPDLLLKLGWGCTHRCSYCPLPAHRGKPYNLRSETILNNLEEAMKKKRIRSVALLSDDCGHYQDGESDLFDLIDAIVAYIPDVQIHLEYLYPSFVVKNREKLVALARDGHLGVVPVSIQSASRRLLRMMKRGDYELSHVLAVTKELRELGSDVWTEMIYDYPTETEFDLRLSILVANKYFDAVAWYPYMKYRHTETASEFPWHNGLGQPWQEKLIEEKSIKVHKSANRWDKRHDVVHTKKTTRIGYLKTRSS